MSEYDEDENSDEQNSGENDSGSFKMEKPYSIDRYFGKINGHIKLLQLSMKANLGCKDHKLEIKTSKSSKQSSMLPNTRVNLSIKDKQHKLSIGLKPYCMVPEKHGGLYSVLYPFDGGPADLDLAYSTTLPEKVKFTAKIKDRGELSGKINRTVDVINNVLKLYMEYTIEMSKLGKVQHKSTLQLTSKTSTRESSVSEKYYMQASEKMSYKYNSSSQNELKIENSIQVLSHELKGKKQEFSSSNQSEETCNEEQTSKASNNFKAKPLHQFKFYSCHKLTQKSDRADQFYRNVAAKSSFCASENIYNTNFKVDLHYASAALSFWEAKSFVQSGKWRLGFRFGLKQNDNASSEESKSSAEKPSYSSKYRKNQSNGKQWQLIVEKDQLLSYRSLTGGVYIKPEEWGVRLWGKLKKRHKLQVLLRSKTQKNNSRDKSARSGFDVGIKYNYNV